MLKSLSISSQLVLALSFSFANLSFSRQSILIHIPIDREILRLFQFASQHPSQRAEQIRVLSEFKFKSSFRNKRTYSRRIRLALGIR